MDIVSSNKSEIKKILLGETDWKTGFEGLYRSGKISAYNKIEIMWIICDVFKDVGLLTNVKDTLLQKAVEIAEDFIATDIVDEKKIYTDFDRYIKEDKDVRTIATVKGTLCSLLVCLISQLNTSYYKRLLTLVQQLLKDNSLYVRRLAFLPLGAFTINIYAKSFPDGRGFKIDSKTVREVIRATLADETNRKYPRVLEYAVQAFDRLRNEGYNDAEALLNYLVYKKVDTKSELQSNYIIKGIAPLIIYYAEFRILNDALFNNKHFIDLLFDILKKADGEVKSTFVWHFGQVIETNNSDGVRVNKYIEFILEEVFESAVVTQVGLLLEKVSLFDLTYSLNILDMLFKYIGTKPSKEIVWLLFGSNIFVEIAKKKPQEFEKYLEMVFDLWSLHSGTIFIGDYQSLFTSYTFAPTERQEELKKVAQQVYRKMMKIESRLIDLSWI